MRRAIVVALLLALGWCVMRQPRSENQSSSPCNGVRRNEADLEMGIGWLRYCSGRQRWVEFDWEGDRKRAVVWIPPEERWRREAPSWARSRRGEIVADAKRIASVKMWDFEWVNAER
jgi:hypothetical protein